MEILKTFGLFVVTVLAEIVGFYLPYHYYVWQLSCLNQPSKPRVPFTS